MESMVIANGRVCAVLITQSLGFLLLFQCLYKFNHTPIVPNCVSFYTICASLVPRIDDMAWHPAFYPIIQRCRSIQCVLFVSKILRSGSMTWRCDHNPLLPCFSFFKLQVNRLSLLSLGFVH
jgi:hypothetical protein